MIPPERHGFDLRAFRYQRCDVCDAETMHVSRAEGRAFRCDARHPVCYGCFKSVAAVVEVNGKKLCAACQERGKAAVAAGVRR